MSSLTRAFTTRRVKMSIDLAEAAREKNQPHRSQSTKDKGNLVLRHKISAPVQLVHTTNMLSYNAPDLPRTSRSNSSLKSEPESEAPSTTESTPPTSPDVSPEDDCDGPQPNHLSTYFMAPGKTWTPPVTEPAPAIPQRSPSHTKKNSYDNIARQRSISRMSRESEHSVSTKASFSFSRSSSTSTRASSVSHVSATQSQKPMAPPVPPPAPPASYQQRSLKEAHPFGQELAQVTELAEEFGAKSLSKIDEEDIEYIESRGLSRFAADEYLSDIQGLMGSFFNDAIHARPAAPMWI